MRTTTRKSKALLFVAALALTALAVTIAQAEVSQKGIMRLTFDGQIKPKALPRSHEAPVTVSVSTHISTIEERNRRNCCGSPWR